MDDLTDQQLRDLVTRGAAFAAGARPDPVLAGKVVGTYFSKTSTRTRTAFATAALRLGGQLISYGPHDLQLNTGETIADTGKVLSRMLDLLVIRTSGPEAEMVQLSGDGRVPVVNAMSEREHPTQALTDLTTLQRCFGRVDGLRLLYCGEGNNSAVALALALTRFPGTELTLCTPPGYGLPAEVVAQARTSAAASGASIVQRHDIAQLPEQLDAVYTTRWQTTGTSKADPDWRTAFQPFQVDQQLMDRYPRAVFLHDLPAHRGEEVSAEVLDGPRSIAFDQAENKLHSAMAVLEWCSTGRTGEAEPGRVHPGDSGRLIWW
ncbi:ornithine carbamoyltransferase [Frankia sp. Ag45/Mut15]|uniref:Ornithine carbamoyltransferase n=1 Tax=Frankia umida TaxID=573489 RepID=A0ABT0K260_9ACTN|nr:ornithine carbamoyltransferase [Frankia umida]MCK9877837.1 ornithine carbamoyltransferase [Frankia umida]